MAAAALMIPAAVTMMILLLNPTACNALTSFEPLLNDTSRELEITFGAGKYLVGEQDMESEFLMESHISRILLDNQNFKTSRTIDPHKAADGGCSRPKQRYDSCLNQKRKIKPPENCDIFNRKIHVLTYDLHLQLLY